MNRVRVPQGFPKGLQRVGGGEGSKGGEGGDDCLPVCRGIQPVPVHITWKFSPYFCGCCQIKRGLPTADMKGEGVPITTTFIKYGWGGGYTQIKTL